MTITITMTMTTTMLMMTMTMTKIKTTVRTRTKTTMTRTTTEIPSTRRHRTRVPTSSVKIEDEDVPPVGAEATIVRRVSRWRVARLHGSYRVWLGCNCQCSVVDERRPASRAPASSPRSRAAFSPVPFPQRNLRFQPPSRRLFVGCGASLVFALPVLTRLSLLLLDQGDGRGC